MKEWHELTSLMTQRVEEDQPTHLQTILILVGLAGGLLPVYFYRWLPSGLLINLLIILPGVLALGRNSVRIELEKRGAELQRRNAALGAAQGPALKIGRNDLCPCGSGKKVKHCCRVSGAGVSAGHST